ncbi:MAG: AAA family ATPase [Gammaproteobacteria bacterium]|nr:AAA family ATPase [Gammaproteobacteria bacterium]
MKALTVPELYRVCDPKQFDFSTTDELDDLAEVIGQSRALEAIQFGIGIRHHGYNIFALGPAGTGKLALVHQLLTEKAAREPVPNDWCYVNNFEQTHKPIRLCLPKGMGVRLSQDMNRLVVELRAAIPALFESEEYRARAQEIEETLKKKQEDGVEAVREAAKKKDIALIHTTSGFVFAPLHDGEVIKSDAFEKLSDAVKQRFSRDSEEFQTALTHVLRQIPLWRREAREQVVQLNTEVAMTVVAHLVDELRERYQGMDAVPAYLDRVQNDIIANVDDFRRTEDDASSGEIYTALSPSPAMRRYEVNVLVDHAETQGAPVVFEDNPTYQNLVGRVEHMALMGALITDFSLIKAGALHRANNGYLVVDALQLLQTPFSWDALKRVLRAAEIRIGSLEQMLSLVSTVTLDPEPIPLNIKVVVLGDRTLYYLLCQLDPEFPELFKVAADFDDRMDRGPEAHALYARLIATQVRRAGLRAFDREGVARVIEHSARLTEDAEKLSTHMRSICDLLCEADYLAQRQGREVVTGADVQGAIDAQIRRGGRMKERLQEMIERNILLIDTADSCIGQVNGLSALDLGDASFGIPVRITAQVRLGEGEVMDIEREVDLGGPIHSKGVLILSGFLGARYAMARPLALSASLVFEQSYGEVEGDSASSAELYALLSALAGTPIKQSFAVTGSVNQHGRIQAVGAVNDKIEGFFDICKTRGLAGDQGVLIPAANAGDLMLRADVREAVAEGRFHVYAVDHIDEGIELLTGVPAGEMDEEGEYPEESINFRVAQQLQNFAEIRHEFNESRKDHADGEPHMELIEGPTG